MPRLWIEELEVEQIVDMTVRVVRADAQRTNNGNTYLALVFADRTARISAKRFGAKVAECEAVSSIRFARVQGNVQEYNGEHQLLLSRPVQDIGIPKNLSDYFECSPIPLSDLQSRLYQHIDSVRDSRLNALLRSILMEDNQVSVAFAEYPAALEFHHTFRHGLLHHTLEVTDLVAAMADQQQNWGGHPVHRNLAVTGALLHDIGKVEEMRQQEYHYEFSDAGSLLGHITQGAIYVARQIAKLRRKIVFPEELEHMLLHLISSHHGKGEWGSPKAPMTQEAILIHTADKTSTDLYFFQEARRGAIGNKSFVKQRKLDSGFGNMGRFVFVGDMDAFVPPVEVTPSAPIQKGYPIPREFRLPFLRLIRAEKAEESGVVTRLLPLIGKIAAGQPILDSDNIEGEELIDATELGNGNGDFYLLRVRGNSMTGDGIEDGDLIVVRHQLHAEHGDLVVAILEGEGATVKRLIQDKGNVVLMPSNPTHPPIPVPDLSGLRIQGRVMGIARPEPG